MYRHEWHGISNLLKATATLPVRTKWANKLNMTADSRWRLVYTPPPLFSMDLRNPISGSFLPQQEKLKNLNIFNSFLYRIQMPIGGINKRLEGKFRNWFVFSIFPLLWQRHFSFSNFFTSNVVFIVCYLQVIYGRAGKSNWSPAEKFSRTNCFLVERWFWGWNTNKLLYMILFQVDGRYTKKHTFPPVWIYFALFHSLLLFLSLFQLSHQNERKWEEQWAS